MATLFTGAYADRHHVRSPAENDGDRMVAQRLRDELHTLAERLKAAGYTTAAFVNQVHLKPKFGFAQGFDHYNWSTGRKAHEVNRALLDWLETAPRRPLFVYVHYLDPHWPYWERVDRLRRELGSLGVRPRPPQDGSEVDDWLEEGLAPGSLQGLRARYDHGVAVADRALGAALEGLRATGLLDHAVVAVTSDHGEGFLEHGRLLHGYEPFDEVARVPLVVRASPAAGLAAAVVGEPVGLVDLMPTLLDLAGLPPHRKGDQGRSLVPLMRGEELAERAIYVETEGVRALRARDAKILTYPDGRLEYYDLRRDPEERRPLPCEARCRELAGELERLLRRPATTKTAAPETVELDEEELERLRSLGYLDG
jgi:arylsulfatase A-like enzyme